ncbi:TetR/AcrR family transcriptional regulator [Chelatococcus asaccharovorans]|uniref:TetR family transcriptional regulator n=1 Tax=Chelatococcus asaccharovorans TaxID=28210 RepID=A0A2V3TWV0_9HYPH|nr:TetR family transcriptional regulator [Chelatococcus asaccharovorans]MBS7705160.1 TetR/AcrR family transcriptional regulator [Chelatococcus asaccharovorans]PXW53657.1 TetR family transcriptional regulator [Chelatococcus asaccharovorans]
MNTGLRPSTSQSGSDSRTEIIDAAARIFMENGLDKVSMRMIAEAVGMSAPSLYHHFASREALVAGIADHAISLYVETVGPTLEGDGSPTEKIATHVEMHLIVEEPRRHLFGIFDHIYRGAVRDPNRRRFAGGDSILAKQSPFSQHRKRLAEVLSLGRQLGEFRFESPQLALACVLGTPKAILQYTGTDEVGSVETMAKFCSMSVIRTLCGPVHDAVVPARE